MAPTALVVTLVASGPRDAWSAAWASRTRRSSGVDEVAGVLVNWIAAPPTWRALIVGGLAFRLFVRSSPRPARRAERLPGGAGVMLNDVAAGVWGTAVALAGRALSWL